MIKVNKKTGEIVIKGKGVDLLEELAVITSKIEEMLAEEVGSDRAEELIDVAIASGRKYNHTFVFKGKEDK